MWTLFQDEFDPWAEVKRAFQKGDWKETLYTEMSSGVFSECFSQYFMLFLNSQLTPTHEVEFEGHLAI